ncbi:MAG: transporter substrate-binding domain-containing protein [Alphaproteobacteria bacterium]
MGLKHLAVAAALLGLHWTSVSAAEAPSVWSDVMDSKKLVSCAVPAYQPYSWKDKDGQWQGFAVEMAKDVAKSLHVELVFIETSFKTVVLDLQSAKCHVFFGFNATPERALAIDFAGPLYTLGFLALDRKGWAAPGNRWADLNDPQDRVCYSMGNSSEQQIRRFAAKSTQVALGQSDECVLALLSGRVDTYIDGVMGILGAKQKNPDLGQVRMLTPQYALPSYAGVRLDADGRFQKFLQRWSEYNRANGNVTQWLTHAMESVGIDTGSLPPEIQF